MFVERWTSEEKEISFIKEFAKGCSNLKDECGTKMKRKKLTKDKSLWLVGKDEVNPFQFLQDRAGLHESQPGVSGGSGSRNYLGEAPCHDTVLERDVIVSLRSSPALIWNSIRDHT